MAKVICILCHEEIDDPAEHAHMDIYRASDPWWSWEAMRKEAIERASCDRCFNTLLMGNNA